MHYSKHEIRRYKDMSHEEKRVWGIHTLDDNLFLQHDVIAIGWNDMGDLSQIEANREAFKERYAAVYPEARKAGFQPMPACSIDLSMRSGSAITWYFHLKSIVGSISASSRADMSFIRVMRRMDSCVR